MNVDLSNVFTMFVMGSKHSGKNLEVRVSVACSQEEGDKILARLEKPISLGSTIEESVFQMLNDTVATLQRENTDLKNQLAMAEQALRQLRGLG